MIDFVAPPSLADAFAASPAAPAFVAYAADDLPSLRPGISPTAEIDVARFKAQHRRGQTGVGVYALGVTAVVVAVPMIILGAFGDAGLASSGMARGLAGGGAMIAGEVLLFSGGITGANSLGLSNTVGWAGVGLAIGGLVTLPLGIGAPVGFAGLVCGLVQLGQNDRAAREIGVLTFHVVPRPDGIAVAGISDERFSATPPGDDHAKRIARNRLTHRPVCRLEGGLPGVGWAVFGRSPLRSLRSLRETRLRDP